MIKDKLSSAIPPEDVIVRKSKLVDVFSNAGNSPFFRKYKTQLIIVCAVLVIALCLTIGFGIRAMPYPTAEIGIEMYAVCMDNDMNRKNSGSVTIRGTRLDYHDEARIPEFQADEIDLLGEVFDTDAAVLFYQSDGTIMGNCHSRSGVYILSIDISPDSDWCVICREDRGSVQYIVCSQTEDFDPMEIFAKSIFAKSEG